MENRQINTQCGGGRTGFGCGVDRFESEAGGEAILSRTSDIEPVSQEPIPQESASKEPVSQAPVAALPAAPAPPPPPPPPSQRLPWSGAPTYAPPAPPIVPPMAPTSPPQAAAVAADESSDTWACPACTFINPGTAIFCEMCSEARPDNDGAEAQAEGFNSVKKRNRRKPR